MCCRAEHFTLQVVLANIVAPNLCAKQTGCTPPCAAVAACQQLSKALRASAGFAVPLCCSHLGVWWPGHYRGTPNAGVGAACLYDGKPMSAIYAAALSCTCCYSAAPCSCGVRLVVLAQVWGRHGPTLGANAGSMAGPACCLHERDHFSLTNSYA